MNHNAPFEETKTRAYSLRQDLSPNQSEIPRASQWWNIASDREKILAAITLGSLIISGIAISLSIRNRQTKADTTNPESVVQAPIAPTSSSSTSSLDEAFEISLVSGWNVITLPKFTQMTNMSDIFGKLTSSVYVLDSGEWRQVGSGELIASTGYLVKLSASSSITINKKDVSENRSPYIQAITKGYTLVGNPFQETINLPTLLIKKKRYSAKEAIDDKFVRMYRWNPGLQKFEKLVGDELIKKYEAFLIQSNDAISLTFIK